MTTRLINLEDLLYDPEIIYMVMVKFFGRIELIQAVLLISSDKL